mgnify:CR=1 FL=1
MNMYEAVFIMNPVLSAEQVGETVAKVKDLIKSKEGKILNEEDWGLKKMAYPIQHKRSGFYHLLEFEAPGEAISSLEVDMKRDERIMRFLTMRMDKHHVAFAKDRRKKMSNASK